MNKQTKLLTKRAVLTAIILFTLGLGSCSTPTPPPTLPVADTPTIVVSTPEPTKPPPPENLVLDPAGPEVKLDAGQKLAVKANANGATQYEWTLQGDGELSATTGPAVLYTAPKESTMAIITVTASNDQGAAPAMSITVNVLGIAAIKLDAVGIPAGWMTGGGNPATYIKMEAGDASECRPGTPCQQVTNRVGGGWNGVMWWPLSCGETGADWTKVKEGTCGVNILTSGALSVINSLTFWAKGDQGKEVIQFTVGDVAILPSPGRSTGKIALTKDWEQYTLDLKGVDLTNAIALFTWVATDQDNQDGAIFYLSEIQFEGVK